MITPRDRARPDLMTHSRARELITHKVSFSECSSEAFGASFLSAPVFLPKAVESLASAYKVKYHN